MKSNHLLIVALITNVALCTLVASRPSHEEFDVVTVREFRLVDKQNRERANIQVEEGGEVVFRLRDESGTIRVKLGADNEGSGFVFLDENTDPVIHGLAGKDGGKLTITDRNGKKREY